MSANFSPQPQFTSNQGLSTASMHAPFAPGINNPAPNSGFNYLNQNYWQGAVHMNAGSDLIGEVAGGDFTNFVCSFWAANLLPIDQLVLQHFVPCIIAPQGSFLFSQDPFSNPTFSFGQFCVALSWDGTPLLFILNAASTSIVRSYVGFGPVMGVDSSFDPILPAGVWHHFIVSYSPSKVQFVVDRVNFTESTLGSSRGAFHNSSDWTTLAPTNASIELAYFYFGTSDTFFDLTTAGNLDYFVSSSVAPVNLGPAGRNVTPLTCRIMHTGNATNLFGVPTADPWQAGIVYGLGAVVTFNGVTYFSIGFDNLNRQPGISPNEWEVFTPTTGYQFFYNAATGLRWGGTLSNAATQPPQGA